MELKLAKKKLFEGMEIECYEDVSRENGDFFMTAKQIGESLQYKDKKSYYRVISRNIENIGNSTVVSLTTIEGKREVSRDIELYSFSQLFQILRFSKQPKANLFMQWATITLQELITGRAKLKFQKQEDKEIYKKKINELGRKVDNMTEQLHTMDTTMGTLINSATINSYQAKQLNKFVRKKISILLGGSHSINYKKKSRMYFKNIWLNLCDKFQVSEYRDLNPLNYNDAVTFINNWSMM